MKKTIFLAALTTLLFCTESISQTIIYFADRTFTRENGLNKATDDEDPNIDGSKYIKSEFNQATLSTHPDLVFNVRYNAFNDDIEIQGKENTSYALNKYTGTVVVTMLSGDIYINSKYIDKKDNLSTGFFQVLNNSGDFFLLKKEAIILKERVEAKTTYHKSKNARYERKNDAYFIKINNGTSEEVPTKSKKFAALFPDIKNNLLKYIKDNKIKLKKEEDLIKVFKYIGNSKKTSN